MSKLLLIGDTNDSLESMIQDMVQEQPDWEISTATNEQSAQESINSGQFNALISDSRMVSEFSDSFHTTLSDSNQDRTHLLLCQAGELEWLAKHPGIAHEYLDGSASAFSTRFQHSLALHELLNGDSPYGSGIAENILPTLPSTYAKVVEALDGEATGISEVAEVVTHDVALSAKVLHLVNSAYFGRTQKVASIQDAISLLGLETVKALTLTEAVFNEYDNPEIEGISVQEIYDRCLQVALSAQTIARKIGLGAPAIAQSFFAGLLHQIGKLIFLVHFPDQLQIAIENSKEKGISLLEAESELMGANHALLGSYLLATWRFPYEVSDVVAYCEDPFASPSRIINPLTAVYLATQQTMNHSNTVIRETNSAEYFQRIGMDNTVIREILGTKTAAVPTT